MIHLGFFQYAVIQRNREANLTRIGQALQHCRCDLLVLPELFTCGYAFDHPSEVANLAENPHDSPTVKFLQPLAARIGGAITGTIPERCGDQLFNTAILINADGLIGLQRKVHLPEYEKRFFTPGDAIRTLAIDNGMRVGMMSCFDCWFPQFGALLRQQGAQIYANSASFGGDVTPTILPIRARENQVFVISCNRIGAEMFGTERESFCGQSQIISPDGRILAAADQEEKLAVVEADPAELAHPAFGALICNDFTAEHARYHTRLLP